MNIYWDIVTCKSYYREATAHTCILRLDESEKKTMILILLPFFIQGSMGKKEEERKSVIKIIGERERK